MTSADSLRQVLLRSSHSVRKASQGKSTIFPVIYPPHLHREFRIAWGFSLCCNLTHSHMPDAVPVRRTNGLPRASFRFHLTMDTLAFGYALGAIPCAQDFHPLDCAHAWHTTKSPDFRGFCHQRQVFSRSGLDRVNRLVLPCIDRLIFQMRFSIVLR